MFGDVKLRVDTAMELVDQVQSQEINAQKESQKALAYEESIWK